MTASSNWLSAFPVQPANQAVEVLLAAWKDLTETWIPGFNPKTTESRLTKKLKVYIENVVARQYGLLGMWAAEDVIGDVDPATGEWVEERRTDIVYGWNDASQSIKIVFEFKRMGKQKRYRDHYLHDNGLARFVTGIYSREQAVAAMVGILLDPEGEVVPPLCKELDDPALRAKLRLRPNSTGEVVIAPAGLFPAASFDTEHDRDPALASTHGMIHVSHFFLEFGYPASTTKSTKT